MACGGSDHILDFFDLSKPFERLSTSSTTPDVPPSQVSKFWKDMNKEQEDLQGGTSYSKKYRRRQEEEIRRSKHTPLRMKQVSNMMDIESVSEVSNGMSTNDMDEKSLSMDAINTYNNSIGYPLTILPIDRERDHIIKQIEANKVTIITGLTGCGKTTRVPQFIFDHCFSNNMYCNIIVTQPRRIAAHSVARRICDERGLKLGGLVGYKVGLDRENVSEDTRMLFCTTGILLKILVSQRNTHEFTHIILDEVHERDIDMDFVLLLVKKFIFTNSRGTKLILMSATCDPYHLRKYFSWRVNNFEDLASHIKVGGSRTPYKIDEYFLCNKELIRVFKCKGIGPNANKPEPKLDEKCIALCRKLIENLDKLENYSTSYKQAPGAVLVFLPGEYEIQVVKDHLVELKSRDVRSVWKIVPLHSRIPSEERELIFRNYNTEKNNNRNIRKIILSTNMAESSITIPDIVYVIDFCLTKNLRAEKSTNYVALRLEWADKSSLEQRKGRSGRVAEGRVYRLISREFYDNYLVQYHDPEILRAPLDKVILSTKLLDQGPPKEILALAMNPPDLSNVYKSVMHLKEIGALLSTVKGKEMREDGDLTTLGEVIAFLPVDVRIGKLIVLGHLFNILHESVIIAAGMSHNSIFVNSFNNRAKSYEYKLMWSDGTFSDGIAIKLAYEKWQNLLLTGRFKGIGQSNPHENELNWCRSNFLELKALKEMHSTIRDIQASLLHNGIQVFPRPNVSNKKSEHQKYLLIRIVMFGAFYPNYFIQSQNSLDSKEVNKTIYGKDHRNTLYFTGFPNEQVPYAPLYFGQIRNFFNGFIPADENIRIEVNGSKVLVSFNKRNYESLIEKQCSYRLNGTVLQQVLVGVKLRKVERESFKLLVYPPNRASLEFEKYKYKLCQENLGYDGVPISKIGYFEVPLVGKSFTKVNIVHVNDPNSFYVHFINTKNFRDLFRELFDSIKTLSHQSPRYVKSNKELKSDHLYLAEFTDEFGESQFYRCRLERFSQNSPHVDVFFIDYGNKSTVSVDKLIKVALEDIKQCPSIIQVPVLAVESMLSFVKANPIRNKHMIWSSASINAFKSKVDEQSAEVKVHVYSVVLKSHNEPFASLELISEKDQASINDWLKSEPNGETPYACHSNESYMSEESHKIRNQLCHTLLDSSQSVSILEYVSKNFYKNEFDDLMKCDQRETIYLKGPFHPLESSLYCLHELGSSKLVNICSDSVNSVLLKQFPNEDIDLWVVAGVVNLTSSGDRLSLRSTNFMPAIPAFGSIMSMIFGPRVELRYSTDRTKLTGAIVGLGDRPSNWNKKVTNAISGESNRVPYHKDHDMEIEFDAMIDMDDIEYINKIRFSINYVLSRQVGNYDLSLDALRNQIKPRYTHPTFLGECHDNIDKYLNHLMSKNRKAMDKIPFPKAYQWAVTPEDLLIKVPHDGIFNGYLKLIDHLQLKCKTEEDIISSELRNIAIYLKNKKFSFDVTELKCPLCPGGETFQDYYGLLEHCEDLLHTYRETNFWKRYRETSRLADFKAFENVLNGKENMEHEIFCPLCNLKPLFYNFDEVVAHSLEEHHLEMRQEFVREMD
ncbi:probable ATP-dependent RNA helicase spindle-E [Lepeophtheirus salmonis]|uniref:probable ATP-dependent RNA helicase spindle-E n=1 Tax=Lepeophtheirus salmonis TaxID=72036 RepID=UPI001AE1588B|nr:probable ATP-dependent RNA helicase spindle-E [Lepeophtheirus salmonis]